MQSARRVAIATTLLAACARGCGDDDAQRHSCDVVLTDSDLQIAQEYGQSGPDPDTARTRARHYGCEALARRTEPARELVDACEHWRLAASRGLDERDGIEILHVCRWDALDVTEPPFAEPTGAQQQELNAEAMSWRGRLLAERDAYAAACTTDDVRFTAAFTCRERGLLDEIARGCGAQSAH